MRAKVISLAMLEIVQIPIFDIVRYFQVRLAFVASNPKLLSRFGNGARLDPQPDKTTFFNQEQMQISLETFKRYIDPPNWYASVNLGAVGIGPL